MGDEPEVARERAPLSFLAGQGGSKGRPVDDVVRQLGDVASDLDVLWREAVARQDFETWTQLADASRAVRRALTSLTGGQLLGRASWSSDKQPDAFPKQTFD